MNRHVESKNPKKPVNIGPFEQNPRLTVRLEQSNRLAKTGGTSKLRGF